MKGPAQRVFTLLTLRALENVNDLNRLPGKKRDNFEDKFVVIAAQNVSKAALAS